ncbi:metallophosphoesterase [Burkholderia ubonensis]|uniref:metallophosphoesterase n=1 Tax=Burkholderia ubonensis TaxID=101571 RepID=UPI0007569A36|nr:metallophosphoesterase [Burkholderia ubonensis]KVP17242.1 serine/threonine protein phosphatase [Burkholderia ubonensis]
MRIHLLSDLHNEFGARYQPAILDADVTVLAGDIDVKGRGVAWARDTFAGHVLYVPGNHEYYGGHVQRTFGKMQAAGDDRVRVLDRQAVVIDGVRFLGATGWTDFNATGNVPLATWDARQHMNDYRKIRHAPGFRKWTPDAAREEAMLSLVWLREQLAQPFDGKTVVISHHAPSTESINGHASAGSHLDASYVNRWESLFGEGLDLWLHGHTHFPVDYTLMGTRVVSNPRGYPGEKLDGFNPTLIIEI